MTFHPFQNSVQSTQIDDLTLENQGDRVSIYGSLNLGLDRDSLQQAEQLHAILQQAIDYLKSQPLAEHKMPIQYGEEIENPFL